MTTTATGRWRGVVAVALFAGAVGVLATRPAVLFLAVLGVGLALYPRILPEPPAPDVEVERTVTPERPTPGESVDVSLVVRNGGDRWLPDLRIVDGVPPSLAVVDGSPRAATALPPGGEVRLEYTVGAESGKHWFDPVTVLSRDLSGGTERRTSVGASTAIDCGAPIPAPVVRSLTRHRPGPIPVDETGSGVEFSRTREYRPGDPAAHIDWRRFAQTGELSTIEFETTRSAAVVVCVDAAWDAETHSRSRSRCLAAADRFVTALADGNHEVGLAALGSPGHWTDPGAGTDHFDRLRRLLRSDPAFVPTAPGALPDGGATATPVDADDQAAAMRERLGARTQVQITTPLSDDGIVRTVLSLEEATHPVVVVSPDLTGSRSVGGRIAAIERATRIRSLRAAGVPVVDWGAEEPLGTAVAAELERSA